MSKGMGKREREIEKRRGSFLIKAAVLAINERDLLYSACRIVWRELMRGCGLGTLHFHFHPSHRHGDSWALSAVAVVPDQEVETPQHLDPSEMIGRDQSLVGVVCLVRTVLAPRERE